MSDTNGSRPIPTIQIDRNVWMDAAHWQGARYRRENFFFPSGGESLYGSLYASTTDTRPFGVVVCPSWGLEGRFLLEWCHQLALGAAEAGGAGLVVQWPGSQDSGGEPEDVTLEDLAAATRDAVAAGDERCPDHRWALVGVRIGAAAAAVAAPDLETPYLLMVQPVLDPAAYFRDIERYGRLARLDSRHSPNWAFGHATPSALRSSGAADQIQAALGAYRGKGAVVRYRNPKAGRSPDGFKAVVLGGDWLRPPMSEHQPLRLTALRLLRRVMRRGRD